ncbi:hypothetical protein B0H13DRAFT_1900489 [Mycena leptocephala]|nr:hypothetical protein B0H13DRAFT_1900489 [Mycena leptocephala]
MCRVPTSGPAPSHSALLRRLSTPPMRIGGETGWGGCGGTGRLYEGHGRADLGGAGAEAGQEGGGVVMGWGAQEGAIIWWGGGQLYARSLRKVTLHDDTCCSDSGGQRSSWNSQYDCGCSQCCRRGCSTTLVLLVLLWAELEGRETHEEKREKATRGLALRASAGTPPLMCAAEIAGDQMTLRVDPIYAGQVLASSRDLPPPATFSDLPGLVFTRTREHLHELFADDTLTREEYEVDDEGQYKGVDRGEHEQRRGLKATYVIGGERIT